MTKFRVEVRRETWKNKVFTVEAENKDEAECKAMAQAADMEWEPGQAEYYVEDLFELLKEK